MMTIEGLKSFGADVESGLGRCMNNEAFYLRLVEKSLSDPSYDRLKDAIAANDLDAAFEAAHALKGVAGNLSITPVFDAVSEITELLRARTQTDYAPILQTILEKRDALKQMCEG